MYSNNRTVHMKIHGFFGLPMLCLLCIAATVPAAEPPAGRAVSAKNMSEADAAWEKLQAAGIMLANEAEFAVHMKRSPSERSQFEEDKRRAFSALAADFYDRFPKDGRRAQAMAIFFSPDDPHFVAHYPPVQGDYTKWTLDDSRAYSLSLPYDDAARDAWLRKSELMVADVVNSTTSARTTKEAAEWQMFGRYFRVATYQHRWRRDIPVDWSAFTARFDAHIARYSDLEILGQRGDDYLGSLKPLDGAAAAAGWRHVLASTSADTKTPGIVKLRAIAEKHLQELGVIASGKIFELVKFTAVDGSAVDLSAMKGRVILLNFWAMWCGPCQHEMPRIKALYEQYHSQGLNVIGVSCDGGHKEQLIEYLTERGYAWPQHFDGGYTGNEMARLFDVTSWPTTFLIGKDGQQIGKNWRGAGLEAAVRQALGLPAAE